MKRYGRVLRERRFRTLWLGATVSNVGDSVSLLALIWLVYTTGGSATKLGWFVAAYTAPVIVGGPLAGIVLDRFDRRLLMSYDNLVRGVLVAALPLLSFEHALRLWQVYLFAIAYGFLKMIPLAGVPAILPDLVEPHDLDVANALESISFYLSTIVGPALAGLLIAAVGAINVLWLDAASYLLFALALLRIGQLPRAEATSPSGERSVRQAFLFVIGIPVLLATTLMFMLVNIGAGIVEVITPVYVNQSLHAGAAAYGALLATAGAAGLVGAFAAGAGAGHLPLGHAIAFSEIAAGVAYGFLAATPPLALAFLAFAVGALCLGPLTVWAQTIRMRLIPPEMRGRIFGTMRSLMQATPPLGALVAGALLRTGGMQLAALATAVLLIAPAVISLALGSLDEQTADRTDSKPTQDVENAF
jgi:MFS family permease